MVKLADAVYHRRRGEELLAGRLDPDGWVDAGDGRRWRPPNISSLSRARGKLGADPLRMLFEHVAGPVGAGGAAGGVCSGGRGVSGGGPGPRPPPPPGERAPSPLGPHSPPGGGFSHPPRGFRGG